MEAAKIIISPQLQPIAKKFFILSFFYWHCSRSGHFNRKDLRQLRFVVCQLIFNGNAFAGSAPAWESDPVTVPGAG